MNAELSNLHCEPLRLSAPLAAVAMASCVFGGLAMSCLGGAGSIVSTLLLAGLGFLLVVVIFTPRPFPLFCVIVSMFAGDALVRLIPGGTYSVTLSKLLGLPLLFGCLHLLLHRREQLYFDAALLCPAAFLGWVGLSWFSAADPGLALRDTMTFAQLMILMLAVRLLVTSRERLKIVLYVAVTSVALSGAVGIKDFVDNPAERIRGVGQNAALLAADLCGALAFCVGLLLVARSTKARLVWLSAGAGIGVSLLLTLSRSAYLSLFPAAFIGGLYHGRVRRWVVVAYSLAAFAALSSPMIVARLADTSLHDKSTVGHLSSLRAGMGMTLDNPFVGVGVGNYITHYLEYTNDPRGLARTGHNTYLTIASETGIPGLALFVGMHVVALLTLLRTSQRMRKEKDMEGLVLCGATAAALASYMLIGAFHSLHIAKYLWILLGVAGTSRAFEKRHA